jgi:hypothetical protein
MSDVSAAQSSCAAGRQVALAMKSKHTPIGGFAQHDLAKAPK